MKEALKDLARAAVEYVKQNKRDVAVGALVAALALIPYYGAAAAAIAGAGREVGRFVRFLSEKRRSEGGDVGPLGDEGDEVDEEG